MNNFLELNNIRKSFTTEKKINVLRGLSRNFKLGKIYAIMGPSGSGKSTLLNLISLIDKPTSGTVKYDKVEINFDQNEKNDLFRAKKIGIILFSYRIIGMILFEVFQKRWILFLFPNFFEFWIIVIALLRLYKDDLQITRKNVGFLIIPIMSIKLLQEYVLHVNKILDNYTLIEIIEKVKF